MAMPNVVLLDEEDVRGCNVNTNPVPYARINKQLAFS